MACEKQTKKQLDFGDGVAVGVFAGIFLLFALLRVLSLPDQAAVQPLIPLYKGTFTGQVFDALSEEPVEKAIVRLYEDEFGDIVWYGETNGSGWWRAENIVLPQKFRASVECEGYHWLPREIESYSVDKVKENVFFAEPFFLYKRCLDAELRVFSLEEGLIENNQTIYIEATASPKLHLEIIIVNKEEQTVLGHPFKPSVLWVKIHPYIPIYPEGQISVPSIRRTYNSEPIYRLRYLLDFATENRKYVVTIVFMEQSFSPAYPQKLIMRTLFFYVEVGKEA